MWMDGCLVYDWNGLVTKPMQDFGRGLGLRLGLVWFGIGMKRWFELERRCGRSSRLTE